MSEETPAKTIPSDEGINQKGMGLATHQPPAQAGEVAPAREERVEEIKRKLKAVGLSCGYHYNFANHPERCLWTAYYQVAKKIAKILKQKPKYNIDFQGGYYYFNLESE